MSSSSIPRSPSSTTARSAPARGRSSSATRRGSASSNASRSTSSTVACPRSSTTRGRALAAYVGCCRGRPRLRPERHDRRQPRRPLARRSARTTRCSRPTSSTAPATCAWEWVCAPRRRALRPGADPAAASRTERGRRGALRPASERTRVVYVSHVTSTTGLVLPLEEIVARARALDLVTIVDGAHAPGQVPVDLAALGADFYAGNCHKWLCAPKGAGFLHVRPEHQERVDGRHRQLGLQRRRRRFRSGSRSRARATPPPSSPSRTRSRSRSSATGTPCATAATGWPATHAATLCDLLGTEPLAPDSMVAQMATVRLPRPRPDLSSGSSTHHRIEIPRRPRRDDLLRLSVAGYTTRDEIDRLLAALVRELDAEHGQQRRAARGRAASRRARAGGDATPAAT